VQDAVKRAAATHAAERNPQGWASGYYTPHVQPDRLKRLGKSIIFVLHTHTHAYYHTDWLKERVYFEGLERREDYAKQRLGFSAPNIFIMVLNQ